MNFSGNLVDSEAESIAEWNLINYKYLNQVSMSNFTSFLYEEFWRETRWNTQKGYTE